MRLSSALVLAPLGLLTYAKPMPNLNARELDPFGDITAIVQGVLTAVANADPAQIVTALENEARSTNVPTTPEEAASYLQAIFNGTSPPPATLYDYIADLEALNLIDSISDLLGFVEGEAAGQASTNNVNPPPPDVIYPQKSSCDAVYDLDENTLRSAIYIPPGFTYGQIPPVILFPGTGNFGYETFQGNFIPLLTGSDFADPVWVNVPGRLLNDAQKNAEFAAYAINYIASVVGGGQYKTVTVLGWSQGNIDTQWAFKYWPSTTLVTTDHVAISPDYAGTFLADFIALPGEPLPPSVLQQEYLQSSNFITTLRNCNGDSAYVPTTTVYSGFFDEIVEPQQGTGASAYLLDARGVGVTNNEAQLVCPLQPAGTFYTHEGMLYNPLSYYLLRDAMSRPGPGDPKNLDLANVCSTYLTPGLNLGDLLVTENAIAIAGLAILTYLPPTFVEPAISAYASTCPVSTCISTSTSTSTTASTSTTTSSTLTTTTSGSTTTTGSSSTISTTTSSTSGSTSTTTASSTTSTTTGTKSGTLTGTTSSSTSGTSSGSTTGTTSGSTSGSTSTTTSGSTTGSTTGTKSGTLTSTTSVSSTSTSTNSPTSTSQTNSTSSTWYPWTTGSVKTTTTTSQLQWKEVSIDSSSSSSPTHQSYHDEPSTTQTQSVTWAQVSDLYTPSAASASAPSPYEITSSAPAWNNLPKESTPSDDSSSAAPTWNSWSSASPKSVTSMIEGSDSNANTWASASWSNVAASTPASVAATTIPVLPSSSNGAAWSGVNGTGVVAVYKGAADKTVLSDLMMALAVGFVGVFVL